jgi:arylsulfatase
MSESFKDTIKLDVRDSQPHWEPFLEPRAPNRHRRVTSRERTRMTLYPGAGELPELAGVPIAGRSFSLLADITVYRSEAQGVVYALGSRSGGHALFLKDKRVHYVYNWLGELEQKMVSNCYVPMGRSVVGVRFKKTCVKKGAPHGTARLFINDQQVATMTMKIQSSYFSLCGEGSNVGLDRWQAVSSDYQPPYRFQCGTIKEVVVDVGGNRYLDIEREVAAGFARDCGFARD